MGESDGRGVSGEKDFFSFFCKADEGEVFYAEGFYFFDGHGELSLASVHDDEVRHGFVFTRQATVATTDDLCHGGEVVLPFDGFDPVPPVCFSVGLAVAKAYHGGDDVVAGNVGNVKALHDFGRGRESESFSQFLEVFDGADGGGQAASGGKSASGFERGFQVLEDVAQMCRFFKLEFGRGLLHFFFESFQEFSAAFAFENGGGFFESRLVLFFADAVDAGGGALADDVVVAVLVVCLVGILGDAGAQTEFLVEPVHGSFQGSGMGKGTPVATAIVPADAGQFKSGVVSGADTEEVIALVVSEFDVVAGAPFLDEFFFEDEGFLLCLDGVKVEVGYGGDQCAGLRLGGLFARGGKVASQAFFQILRLADIDDSSQGVFHNVDAGLVWRLAPFFFHLGGTHAVEAV